DGEVVESNGLEIDESLLTGESDPVHKELGDEVLSGSFVAAGSGQYRATRVGGDSYAARLAKEGKRFTLVRSEMREGIDWILGAVSWLVVPMMVMLIWSALRADPPRGFIEGLAAGAAAGVAMVPQGLVLLASMAFAVGVIRLGRRQVLVQEMPAIEGLARVDTICFDTTGTLTNGRITVEQVVRLGDEDYAPALAAPGGEAEAGDGRAAARPRRAAAPGRARGERGPARRRQPAAARPPPPDPPAPPQAPGLRSARPAIRHPEASAARRRQAMRPNP